MVMDSICLLSKLYNDKFYYYKKYDTPIFKIQDYIEKGSQGIVLKAINNVNKKIVAIKIIKINRFSKKNINGEINFGNLLINHPNIIKYNSIFKFKAKLYIVMNYYEQDLYYFNKMKPINKKIKRKYQESEIKIIVVQLLKALEHLQKFNIYHTDIKLENVILNKINKINNIKLIDFTNYLKINKNKDFVEIPKFVYGTLDYIAPETINGKFYKNSDLWSLGILIYYLLNQTFLYSIIDLKDIKQKKINVLIEKISDVSENFKLFLNSILMIDVTKRLTINKALNHIWIKNTNNI